MAIDLAAIRSRNDEYQRTAAPISLPTLMGHLDLMAGTAADVPALLTELDRVNAVLAAVQAEHMVEYDSVSNEVYGTNPRCSCGRRSFPCDTGTLLAELAGV